MAGLPLHPVVVHLPLVLALLVPIVVLAATIWARREGRTRRAWMIAAALQGAIVVTGVVALKTGERDEERVERFVPETAIHAHEEAAELFVAGAACALAVTIGAGLLHRRLSPWAGILATVAAVAVAAQGVRTGHAGGRLVYQEGAAAAWAGTPGAPAAERPTIGATESPRGDDDD